MSVRVVARIRPLLEKELEKDVIVHAASNSSSNQNGKPYNMVKIPNPKNEAEEFSFTFNGVYDHSTTQEALFSAEGNASFPTSAPLAPWPHGPTLYTRHDIEKGTILPAIWPIKTQNLPSAFYSPVYLLRVWPLTL